MFACQLDDHVALRLMSLTDAEESSAVVTRNLAHLAPWMPWATAEGASPEGQRAFLTSALAGWSRCERLESWLTYDGAIIGAVGLPAIHRAEQWAEAGYWIDRDYEGRGYVTAGVRALERIVFVDLGLERIQICQDAANARSRAIPERLGYTLEGVLRRHTVSGAEGRHADHSIYGLLKPEWEARVALEG